MNESGIFRLSGSNVGGKIGYMKAVARLETNKIDEAAENLSSIAGKGLSCRPNGPAERFFLKRKSVAFTHSTVITDTGSGWSLVHERHLVAGILIPLKGRITFRSGTLQYNEANSTVAAILRPDEQFSLDVSKGTKLAYALQSDQLIERAEALTSRSFNPCLLDRMAATIDVAAGPGQALKRIATGALQEIAELESISLSRLAMASMEEMISNFAIVCLFPEVRDLLSRPQSNCGPLVLREARDYIHEHALEPIQLSELAKQLNISIRTLQHYFQHYYGLSPRDYLTQCRLDKARDLLMTRTPSMKIGEIALNCGFSSPSYFVVQYRARFGETPSETVARHRL